MLWLLGVTSGFSPDTAAVMVEIHVFISSWRMSRRRQRGRKQSEQQEVLMMFIALSHLQLHLLTCSRDTGGFKKSAHNEIRNIWA